MKNIKTNYRKLENNLNLALIDENNSGLYLKTIGFFLDQIQIEFENISSKIEDKSLELKFSFIIDSKIHFNHYLRLKLPKEFEVLNDEHCIEISNLPNFDQTRKNCEIYEQDDNYLYFKDILLFSPANEFSFITLKLDLSGDVSYI